MATLAELHSMWANDTLKVKVESALALIAEEVRTEVPATPNHDKRAALAAKALDNPAALAPRFMRAMLAQNAGATLAQIQGIATAANNSGDAAILNGVRSAWDIIALSGL